MKIKYNNSKYFYITKKPWLFKRDILSVGGTSLWQKIKGILFILTNK